MKILTITVLSFLVLSIATLAQEQDTTTLDSESLESVTVSAPVSTVGAPRRKFTFNYVFENYALAAPTNTGDFSQFSSEQHIGITYHITPTKRLQVRQYFLYNVTDYNVTNEWAIGDHAIQFTDTGAFRYKDMPFSYYARLYLPGSEFSREVGKYELRLLGELVQKLPNRFSLSYIIHPRIYAYTGYSDGLNGLRLFPAVYLYYEENLQFVPYVGAFTEHRWRHTGRSINYDMSPQASDGPVINDSFYHSLGLKIQPSNTLSINFYTETEDSLRDGESVSFLSDDHTYYYLDVVIGL